MCFSLFFQALRPFPLFEFPPSSRSSQAQAVFALLETTCRGKLISEMASSLLEELDGCPCKELQDLRRATKRWQVEEERQGSLTRPSKPFGARFRASAGRYMQVSREQATNHFLSHAGFHIGRRKRESSCFRPGRLMEVKAEMYRTWRAPPIFRNC